MTMPKLKQIAANLCKVEIGENEIYFSYQTPVAVFIPGMGLVVSENQWSVTTGKHLTMIDGGSKEAKAKRRPAAIFDAIVAGLEVK